MNSSSSCKISSRNSLHYWTMVDYHFILNPSDEGSARTHSGCFASYKRVLHRKSISYCHSPRFEASVGFELPLLARHLYTTKYLSIILPLSAQSFNHEGIMRMINKAPHTCIGMPCLLLTQMDRIYYNPFSSSPIKINQNNSVSSY
jgi:hypothetical protein